MKKEDILVSNYFIKCFLIIILFNLLFIRFVFIKNIFYKYLKDVNNL